MIVLDTSGLLALLDRGEPEHTRAMAAVEKDGGPLILLDMVLAETDYLILRRLGREAERAFLAQILDGVFVREPVTEHDLQRADEIIEAYRDHPIGLTDASVLAVAERLGERRVLTLDHRHFRAFRDRKGRALELLP
jgi:uncharacterized protein